LSKVENQVKTSNKNSFDSLSEAMIQMSKNINQGFNKLTMHLKTNQKNGECFNRFSYEDRFYGNRGVYEDRPYSNRGVYKNQPNGSRDGSEDRSNGSRVGSEDRSNGGRVGFREYDDTKYDEFEEYDHFGKNDDCLNVENVIDGHKSKLNQSVDLSEKSTSKNSNKRKSFEDKTNSSIDSECTSDPVSNMQEDLPNKKYNTQTALDFQLNSSSCPLPQLSFDDMLKIRDKSSSNASLAVSLVTKMFKQSELLVEGVNVEGSGMRGHDKTAKALDPKRIGIIRTFCIKNSFTPEENEEEIWRDCRNGINKRLSYLRKMN